MTFDIPCSACGMLLRVHESQIGSILSCPACGQIVFVEPPTQTPASAAPATTPSQVVAPVVESKSEPPVAPQASGEPGPEALPWQATPEPSAQASPQSWGFANNEPAGFWGPTPAVDLTPAGSANVQPTGSAAGVSPLATAVSPRTVVPSAPAGGTPGVSDANPTAAPAWVVQAPPQRAQAAPQPVQPVPSAEMPWVQPAVSPSPIPQTPLAAPASAPAWTPQPDPVQAASATTAAPPWGTQPTPVAPSMPAVSSGGQSLDDLFDGAGTAVEEPLGFLQAGATGDRTAAVAPVTTPASFPGSAEAAAPAKPSGKFGIYAVVYICGAILGFFLGYLYFGRQVAAARTGLERIPDDGVNKGKTKWVSPKTAVPAAQLKSIGETVQLQSLAVTAMAVQRRKISKVVPSTGASETSEGECLVLRVILRNTSVAAEFVPLDEMFVRPNDPKRRPNYTFIELKDSSPIPMYPLPPFDERNLAGESFGVLKPGESVETIVAAEEESPQKAKGTMVWRLQVRDVRGTGENVKSHSTVVGFKFTEEQIRGPQS